MSSCSRSAEVLEYMLGLMPPELAASFEEHMRECADCLREFEAEKAIEQGLSSSCTAPEGLAARIGTAVELVSWRKRRSRLDPRIAGIAAACSIAVLTVLRAAGVSFSGVVPVEILQEVTQAGARMIDLAGANLPTIATGLVLTAVAGIIATALPDR
jgi:anti-sigma factor (TIGR02949 family)